MPQNPLDNVIKTLSDQLPPSAVQTDQLRRQQREIAEAEIEAEENEPGQPESFK